MKRIALFAFLTLSILLSSCIDTEEKIVLNADNSGTYTLTMDMSKLLETAASFGADKTAGVKQKQKKDSTVYLKDIIDSATNLTAHEKALYRNGFFSVKLDEANNEMKVVTSCPFQNASELLEIKNNFILVLNKLKAFEKTTGDKSFKEDETADQKGGTGSGIPLSDQFVFEVQKGKISSTLKDAATFKSRIQSDSSLKMVQQMSSMSIDFGFKTVIVLPAEVKKFSGPEATVSADKKTISFNNTLSGILDKPEKASYEVEY